MYGQGTFPELKEPEPNLARPVLWRLLEEVAPRTKDDIVSKAINSVSRKFTVVLLQAIKNLVVESI